MTEEIIKKPKVYARIIPVELREAMEKELGISFCTMLAQTQLKLFNDFKKDVHVKEFISFTTNMANKLIEEPIKQIEVTALAQMSRDELVAYKESLLKKLKKNDN